MARSRQILFVGRDVPDEATNHALTERGCSIVLAHDCDKAYSRVLGTRFDLLIVNLAVSAKGIDLIKRVRESGTIQATPVLVLGEWGTGEPSLALSQGADAFEPVPIHAGRLATSIERLLTERAVAAVPNE